MIVIRGCSSCYSKKLIVCIEKIKERNICFGGEMMFAHTILSNGNVYSQTVRKRNENSYMFAKNIKLHTLSTLEFVENVKKNK